MEKSAIISGQAHMAGMSAAGPGRFDPEVEAAIEQAYMANGAMSWGYPSIVGSGPNATILHYNESSRQMQAGELLLVDAAANYKGYTVDITRTYPVSGTFAEAQKDSTGSCWRRRKPACRRRRLARRRRTSRRLRKPSSRRGC